MNRSNRCLVLVLALGTAVALALLPVGDVPHGRQGLVASPVGPGVALALIRLRFITPEFTAPPELEGRGHQVLVQGHIACDPGDLFHVRVTVSQLATEQSDGAVAEGDTRGFCTGDVQGWVADATTKASTVFETGPGKVCAVAITQGKGPINDAFQWCKDVILE